MSHNVQCIGLILDGNRRWAKAKGLSSFEGHKRGFENLIDAVKWVKARGIPHMAFFGFSTENWERSKEEVEYLMGLFNTMITVHIEQLKRDNVRVRFAGQRERFSRELQEGMQKAEEETKNNTGITLWACLSYGGRAEILAAAESLVRSGEGVTETTFTKHLWTGEMPDPDIIVRTSGEQRLSGFLTWKGVYSELFFIPEHWPDFSEAVLDRVLAEYAERERRYGK